MITHLSIRDLKSLSHVEVDLGRVTVLVGQNGAGKSSLLTAAHALTLLRSDPNHFVPFQWPDLYAWDRLVSRSGARALESFSIAASLESGASAQITVRSHHQVTVDVGPPEQHFEAAPFQHPALEALPASALLRLDPHRLRKPSFPEGAVPSLGSDGTGLASRLAWLAGAHPEVLEAIIHDLRTIVPGVRRVRTFFVEGPESSVSVGQPHPTRAIGHRLVVDFDRMSEIPADQLSDGTLLMLGLLTKLHDVDAPSLILCDDIEHGLHIGAQIELAKLIGKLLESRPGLQLICTTHSPYLASQFEPAEVLVMALDGERRTHVARLDEHPEFAQLRYGFQTGELWAALGENWVIEVSRNRNAA